MSTVILHVTVPMVLVLVELVLGLALALVELVLELLVLVLVLELLLGLVLALLLAVVLAVGHVGPVHAVWLVAPSNAAHAAPNPFPAVVTPKVRSCTPSPPQVAEHAPHAPQDPTQSHAGVQVVFCVAPLAKAQVRVVPGVPGFVTVKVRVALPVPQAEEHVPHAPQDPTHGVETDFRKYAQSLHPALVVVAVVICGCCYGCRWLLVLLLLTSL